MGIEYLHSNGGGFFILTFLKAFGSKSLLVNICKRLLLIAAEGHYRAVYLLLPLLQTNASWKKLSCCLLPLALGRLDGK